jgi:flavin-dependent dehydrogenase
MAKSVPPQPDVLVLGEHPSAYLAAILVHLSAKARVMHATIPGEESDDRLVIINPAFFGLHPSLEPLRRKLEMIGLYGLQFLSDDPATRSEHRSKSVLAHVVSYKALRAAMVKVAEAGGVDLVTPRVLDIHRLDESGIDVGINDKAQVRPKVLLVAGQLPEAHQKRIGLPEAWGADVVHRYSYIKLPGTKWGDLGGRPVMPMSLNLKETLCWAWLIPGPKGLQLAVEQPVEMLSRISPSDLLAHWAKILTAHGLLKRDDVPLDAVESIDLPLAGALQHEGVANRTLLVGPAGGFYSACSEDIYPNCWSAVFAADAIKKALKERHLQDALSPYRSKWRTTLGEYLRGPQQNFRFLLPLVYRNEVMTSRLTECILLGKSVVR